MRVETSRSPKTVIATVRGIGVAVMTRTCGGLPGLVGQRGALLDAEPVLLVDDDQAEVEELDVLLEQRVGADDDARPRRWPAGTAARALGLGHRAGEQLDGRRLRGAAEHPAAGQVAEQLGDRPVVLLGQHLGGREQRGLAARVDDPQHRPQRDQGLAGADLALEQPVHRVRLGEVALDLLADLAPGRR